MNVWRKSSARMSPCEELHATGRKAAGKRPAAPSRRRTPRALCAGRKQRTADRRDWRSRRRPRDLLPGRSATGDLGIFGRFTSNRALHHRAGYGPRGSGKTAGWHETSSHVDDRRGAGTRPPAGRSGRASGNATKNGAGTGPCRGVARTMKKPSRRRRNAGFVLLIVMACLAIVTVLVAGWARMAMVENRQQRSAEDRQQARWLAEAALQRAAAHLLLDREYQGETWQVTAADVDRVGKTVPQPDPSAAADTATKAPGVGLVVITTAPRARPCRGPQSGGESRISAVGCRKRRQRRRHEPNQPADNSRPSRADRQHATGKRRRGRRNRNKTVTRPQHSSNRPAIAGPLTQPNEERHPRP